MRAGLAAGVMLDARRDHVAPLAHLLSLMDALMAELAGRPVPAVTRRVVDPAARQGVTLQRYYDEKRRRFLAEGWRGTPATRP